MDKPDGAVYSAASAKRKERDSAGVFLERPRKKRGTFLDTLIGATPELTNSSGSLWSDETTCWSEEKTSTEAEKGVPLPNQAFNEHEQTTVNSSLGIDITIQCRAKALKIASGFVDKLVNTTMKEIQASDGMLVMEDIPDLETGDSRNIVILKRSIPFWEACRAVVDKPFWRIRVCVVGTPGIGKTTTTPLLIRMLLKDKKTVVYHMRGLKDRGWIYVFSPKTGASSSDVMEVETKVYREDEMEEIEALCEEESYYIVDAGETRDACVPPRTFEPKLIVISPPDSRIWGAASFIKQKHASGGVIMVLPVWEWDEIRHAIPYIKLADKTVLEGPLVKSRFDRFGGIPRYIFTNESDYRRYTRLQDDAWATLTKEQVRMIYDGSFDFSDSMDATQPSSVLMAYKVAENDYEDWRAFVVSPFILRKILVAFGGVLWEEMRVQKSASGKGTLFENYSRDLLAMGRNVKLNFTCRSNVESRVTSKKALGGCKEIRLDMDVVAAAKRERNVLFHSVGSIHKLIDFMYQDDDGWFHAFQTTTSVKHPSNIKHVEEIEKQLGDPVKLFLYYLVPDFIFHKFETMPPNPNLSRNGNVCSIVHVMIPKPSDVPPCILNSM